MRYVGSKNRISKYIAPIIQKAINDNHIKTYYEPFVGGANMIDKINCETRIGNDINEYLIAMWQEIQKGWDFPLHISEEEYYNIKNNKDKYPAWYVGLVGFNACFGSRFFQGYARGFKADRVTRIDVPNESLRNLKAQVDKIMDIEFICGDYHTNKYSDITNSVIYCDAPYANTTKYNGVEKFDYDKYWDWVRKVSHNNIVFVSEYNAPADFKCIWQKEQTITLNKNGFKTSVEKLFVYDK